MWRVTALAILVLTFAATIPAYACGGLIGPNGAVNLLRTTTFVGYHDGVEHYVTAFSFAGGGGQFGSIVPLPGVPSSVERGGDWTLQRLVRETQPPTPVGLLFDAKSAGPEVLLQVRIDALDITVLRGGAVDVGSWATAHGFRLPPDAPEVLDFYAQRSPIFLAAVFDADAAKARGQNIGDGTPVHITIPTSNPWVPLRILGLGKAAVEKVDADVYLLTDARPSLLPGPGRTMQLEYDLPATRSLLDDLRADKGMAWIPSSGWLTKLRVDATAGALTHDLAIDATGTTRPSRVAAGLASADAPATSAGDAALVALAIAPWLGGLVLALYLRRPKRNVAA